MEMSGMNRRGAQEAARGAGGEKVCSEPREEESNLKFQQCREEDNE